MSIKEIVSAIISFFAIWGCQSLIMIYLPEEGFVTEVFMYLFPAFIILITSIYLLLYKQKDIAMGIIIGGVIYWLGLLLIIFGGISEMGCGRYFFNLLSTCPGIK